jgi:uridine phosphorylase
MTDDPALIEPRRIPGDPKIDHPILLILFEPYLEIVSKTLKLKKSSWRRLRFPSLAYSTAEVDGKPLSVFGAPLGSPQAALVLERLVAMGARTVVTFGCCGSLQFTLRTGDLVIPTHALSEEGTSAHYPLPEGLRAKADERTTRAIMKCCLDKRLPWADGRVWTTDAIFRETKSKVSRYAQMDILAVEMEMSALFTVAAYRRVSLGGLLVVSDELARPSWKSGFLSPSFWLTSQKAAKAVVEACLALSPPAGG